MNRMRLISALVLLLGIQGCYQVERNCKDFHTGTFAFDALVGTEVLTTTFVRNDSIEIDYFEGRADTSSIRWINDCEYIVQKLNPRNMAEEKAIHMKILSTAGSEYTFEFNIVGETRKERGTARRVQD
jgi:hypothetical protein